MIDENPECCVIMVEANTHQPHGFPQSLILKISTAACLASGNTKSKICLSADAHIQLFFWWEPPR
jgi:hypothetical protein